MSEAPKTFWDDLNKDMEDPEFREAYAEASNEIAANVEASIRRGVAQATAGEAREMPWVTDGVSIDGDHVEP